MSHPNMKKFVVPAVAAALVLAACGPDDNESENGGAASNGDVVNLSFAAVTFTETGRGEALTEWVEGFNESQDRIRVDPAGIPFGSFAQTVMTQLGAGEGPDLIRWDQADFVLAASAGVLAPLDEYIDFSGYDLIEGPDQYSFVDGQRYGVMFDVSSYALIYNMDLVPEPPTTYEEFLALSKELTGDGVFGLAFRQTKEQEPGMMQDLYNFVYGFGGAFSDGTNLTINSPEVLEGLSAFQELYDEEVIPHGADAATYRRMFAENLVAMEIDNGGVPGILLGANEDLNLGAVPIPFPVAAQGGIIVPITINESSAHKEEAAEFIEWMLEEENQLALQRLMGGGSVATVTERTEEEYEEAPYLAVFEELTDSTKPQIIEGYEEQTPVLRTIIVDAVLSALHGEQTMEEALDNAQAEGLAAVGQ